MLTPLLHLVNLVAWEKRQKEIMVKFRTNDLIDALFFQSLITIHV